MNDLLPSTSSFSPWLVPVLVGAASGFLGGSGASWWFREAPDPRPRDSVAAPLNSEESDELERRIGELEEVCSFALRQSAHRSASSRAESEPNAAAPASSGGRATLAGPALEAAVRDVLTRLEDEEYQSREARRNQREEARIRAFVSVLTQRAGLDESTSLDVAALLSAKREELRAEKDSFTNSDAAASLTPGGRKEKRRQLEEKVGAELDRALLEILGAERLETYRVVAAEERFELED